MFGYVRPKKEELKVKEFAYYKSVYCGLCREDKKLSHRLSLLLSYDMVLYALLRIGAAGEKSMFGKTRCAANPFRKRTYVIRSPYLRLSAYVSAVLVLYKLIDDINDEKGLKRMRARFLLPGIRRAVRRASADGLEELVAGKIKELSELESKKSDSVYQCAQAFGELLGGVFSYDPPEFVPAGDSGGGYDKGYDKGYGGESCQEKIEGNRQSSPDGKGACEESGCDGDRAAKCREELPEQTSDTVVEESCKKARQKKSKQKKVRQRSKADGYPPGRALSAAQRTCLYEMGVRVGRWIYIIDAAADAVKDAEQGRFNPFVKSGEDVNSDDFKDRVFLSVGVELSLALSALDLLSVEDKGIESIVRNILGMGMSDTARKVIYGCPEEKRGKCAKKSEKRDFFE